MHNFSYAFILLNFVAIYKKNVTLLYVGEKTVP